jgi:hypothetical protein
MNKIHGLVVSVLLLPSVALGQAQQADTFFVSTRGLDTWSGRLPAPNTTHTDGPFASLERARDVARNRLGRDVRGTVIRVRGGLWLRDKPFLLDSANGGSPDHPVVWESFPGELVRLAGAARISGWIRVHDIAVLARLPAVARDSVFVARIPAGLGIQRWTGDGRSRLRPAPSELVWNGHVLNVARWPNTGWDRIVSVDSSRGVRIRPATNRLAKWSHASDAWVMGYWRWDWYEALLRVTGVDVESGEFLVTGNPNYGILAGQRYAIVNLIEELDARGEYWIDVEHSLVYVWPPSNPARADAVLSVLTDPVLEVRGASDLTLRGLQVEASRGDGIRIEGGARVDIVGGTVQSLGGRAIELRGGKAHVVRDVAIQDVGEGGILVTGGDRHSLTASGHLIQHVRFRRFARWVRTNTPAVYLKGVGATVRECDISDGPHSGIIIEGNDHLIENNTLSHLLLETRDAGAINMGRDWTERGHVIRGNYFFALGPDRPDSVPDQDHPDRVDLLQAVHLDDMASGVTVERNVFDHAHTAVLIGGGRDNRIEGNVIVQSPTPLYVDPRGRFWRAAVDRPGSAWEYAVWKQVTGLFRDAHPDSSPYFERYPALSRALTDRPGEPIGNTFIDNFIVGGGEIQRLALLPGMLTERGTVRIAQKDDGLWGPARMQRFLDSLTAAGSRPAQRLPRLSGAHLR